MESSFIFEITTPGGVQRITIPIAGAEANYNISCQGDPASATIPTMSVPVIFKIRCDRVGLVTFDFEEPRTAESGLAEVWEDNGGASDFEGLDESWSWR